MKWYYDMKLSKKMILGFIIVAILASGIGLIGIFSIQSTQKNSQNIITNYGNSQGQLGYIAEAFQKNRSAIRDLVSETDINNFKQYQDIIVADDTIIIKNLAEFKKTRKSTVEIETYVKLEKSLNDYNTEKDQVLALAIQNKDAQATALLRKAAIHSNEVSANIDDNIQQNISTGTLLNKAEQNSTNRIILILSIIVVIAVIASILLGYFISNLIAKPIKRLLEAADKISQGYVDVKVETNTKDEVGELAQAFEKIIVAIKLLSSDVNMMVDAAVAGKLDTRAEISKHSGDYRKIVEGINNTLDAITEPINESRNVLSKMALNDHTLSMTGSYKGAMKDFAEDINSVHARISAVVKLLVEISVGDTKGLEGLTSIGKRSENDELMPSMIVMMTTIQNLVNEASMIAGSAADGNLQVRGDVTKFKGGYREVLEAFNMALDAMEEPINEMEEVLMKMSEGDLCVSMAGDYKGSYGVIKESVNHTLEVFNELLSSITESSEQVLSGSNQVSDGSQALSQGTTEQASSIEELTSSITQVAAQTKQNAVNASQANELALSAKEGAILGNSHMKEMLESMDEINVSSSNISKIIKVIDDIAFQTNMLALNAAVEAARAGQHGKGFAVVAEEVRNLAARSAKAVKETTELVEGSIKKVELGTKIANNTAESLDQIVLGVSKAATLVGEIAAASNEQATAIYQINKGIEQVSDVVQTNSATAEQSAAASEELSSQAAMLKNMVRKFSLKGGTIITHNEVSLETKRNLSNIKNNSLARDEVAVTKSKPRISLSNTEFGKY
ncbi:HAMP domain-containing methyl-accepting chemotaxis protein [Clostridium estertheticum]|uniref:HAMP domain-containing methyl-accepting chemotaxis protein n=1 Tax=Clostridium estertheticum TaxID=238834 RepID=UPI001C0CD537|nr:methyl-accepting chemotaxis protein [Clostridium estertheticum]MBU3074742.1 MCP four helix bundle domain-containing protein [Clostridium estertheticum]MBU3164957.1 MCP four helix bundle domain-containing protein [Clostridium estertheticum]